MTTVIVLHSARGASLSTPFRKAAFGKNDPFARQREIAWEGPAGMAVGRTSFMGEVEVASHPHVETLVVVEGELTLTAPGAAPLVVVAGAGAVIGCGTPVRIAATSRALFTFCAASCDKPTKRGLYPLRADANFQPSNTLPQDVLVSGVPPVCRADNVFTDDAAAYSAGTWDSTPYHRIVRPHKQNEFMHLVAGGVRFAAPDGSVRSTSTGDSLFVPQGASVGWESSERVAKFFVTQKVG